MRILFTLLVSIVCFSVHAQKENETPFPKFGQISASDLQKKSYAIDSNARAVVLQDLGFVSVEGNPRGWFSLVTKRHKIVHILNKNGYSKATIEIPLYSSNGVDEDIKSIKAVTYNLENGKVQETKFDKANIFTVKESKTRLVK